MKEIEQKMIQYDRLTDLIGSCANALILADSPSVEVEYIGVDHMTYEGYPQRLRTNTIRINWKFLSGMAKCRDAIDKDLEESAHNYKQKIKQGGR